MPKFDAPITTTYQNLDRVLANPLPVLLVLTNGSLDQGSQSALTDVARTEAGNLLVAWKDGAEHARHESLTPTQIQETAGFLLGRGPAPAPHLEHLSNDHPVT